MKRNLVIRSVENDGFAEAAGILGKVIGNSKETSFTDALEIKLALYDSIVLLCGTDSLERVRGYIDKTKSEVSGKAFYFVGLGMSEAGFKKKLCEALKAEGIKPEFSGFIHIDSNSMIDIKAVCSMAAEIRDLIYGKADVLSESEVIKAVKEYLAVNNTCTLGTSSGGYVRCTPIEYTYMDDVFYLITEGGMKFYGILQNSNVSLAVYDKYEGMGGNLKGLQIQGTAEIVEMKSAEYYKVMAVKGVKKEMVDRLPVDMNVIKIVPSKFEFLNSDFKKKGADTKQTAVLNK